MIPDEWLPLVVHVGDVTLVVLITSKLCAFFSFLIFGNAQNDNLFVTILDKPKIVHHRIILVGKYYALAVVVMLLSAVWACNSTSFENFAVNHSLINTFGTTIGVFLSMLFISSFSYEEKYYPKIFFFFMHCFLTAPAMSTLAGEICLKAACYAAQLIIILLIVALTAQETFHQKIIGPLSRVNSVVTAASICVSIIGTPKNGFEILLMCLNLHLGLLCFTWIFIVNIQMFITDSFSEETNFDPVYVAAVLHISTLNLLLRIASLMTMSAALRGYRLERGY